MSKQIERNRFILSSIPRLYQQFSIGLANYQVLGNHILEQIKTAKAFRQVNRVQQLAKALDNIPIKEYELIGQYYHIWCQCRELKFDNDALESIIGQTKTYKVKALSSRGTFEWYRGNNETALQFYKEALSLSPTASEYIELSKAVAVLKSQEGFHRSALKDLENIIPIIRYAEPIVYYEFLNSYAVILGETGHLQEAHRISDLTLASPFALAYPEWTGTRDELNARGGYSASRSTVANKFVGPKRLKVIQFPVVYQQSKPSLHSAGFQPKQSVIVLCDYKTRMAKENQSNPTKERNKPASLEEKQLEAMRRISDPDFPSETLDKILELIDELDQKKAQ
jgi:tetratricopeptide (TPR) repeat protein